MTPSAFRRTGRYSFTLADCLIPRTPIVNMASVSQVRVNCNNTVSHTFHGNHGLAVRVRSNVMQLSSQNGVSLSCDLLHKVCSFTLDGWLHGWYWT